MRKIEEEIEKFLGWFGDDNVVREFMEWYDSRLYEMLERVYEYGKKDGQEEYRESFQHHLDEAEAEGHSDGYAEGYNTAKTEIDLDTYKIGYIRGFDDGKNGRPTKVNDEISHIGALFVDLEEK